MFMFPLYLLSNLYDAYAPNPHSPAGWRAEPVILFPSASTADDIEIDTPLHQRLGSTWLKQQIAKTIKNIVPHDA